MTPADRDLIARLNDCRHEAHCQVITDRRVPCTCHKELRFLAAARIEELIANGPTDFYGTTQGMEGKPVQTTMRHEMQAVRHAAAAEAQHADEQRARAERAEAERDALRKDAERYRFLRSEIAGDAGPVQSELHAELQVKLCRGERMDSEVDAAMRLLKWNGETR